MTGEKKTTRLMITKMVLENFKSYAGQQEIGPFHKRFSSIVGPNGSGKSNVIDAMLFVFGKKAKQLRLNKVSELIHKSSNFPNLESCTVAVHFQLIEDDETSDDDYTVVPKSDFIVTRTAYANNTSKYTISGKTASYTEVGTLLRSHGIDLDNNRFLILQGEVEQIAMMKPKGTNPHEEGLLEYLEDIIGSNRFLEQIEEISKTLDSLNDQRIEKVNRMKIAERERDNLSEAKEEVEVYLSKEREVKVQNNILYQAYIAIAEENIDLVTKKQEEAMERLAHEKAKSVESDSKLAEIEKQYETAKEEYDKIHEEVDRTTNEFAAFERRDVKINEDMKYNKAQAKKLQVAVDKDTAKEADSLKEASSAEERAKGIRNTIHELTVTKAAEEAKLDEIMSNLEEGTAEYRKQLESKQAELVVIQRSVAELRTEKEGVSTSLELVKSRSVAACKAYEEAKARIETLQSQHKSNLAKRATAQQTIQECESALQQLNAELIKLTDKEESLKHQVRDALAAAEEAKASMQSSGSGRNETLNTIMRAAKKGGPLSKAGVHGRLGDLGTIAPEYDVAISTACTMLDCIVVDTSEGAQACMDFLRKNNGGRATFIPLDQMKEHAARMTREASFPAQRLFDLIKVTSNQFKPAFYQALGDCLVVDDQETASKVAFEPGSRRAKYKVVTLGGNVIETSGAISGGGSNKRSGGMRAVVKSVDDITPQQVAKLEAEATKLQAQLTAVRSTIKETEGAITEFTKMLKKTTIEVEKSEHATSGAQVEIEELTSRLESLRAETVMTAEEKKGVKSHESRLSSLDAEMERVAPGLKDLEVEVESIQKAILDVGGPKLKRAQAKVDGLGVELDNSNTALSKSEAEASNLKKVATKAASAHKKASEDLEKVNLRIQELVKEKVEMENDALVVIQAVEAAKTFCSQKEVELKSIEKEFHELKEFVSTIKKVEVDLQNLLDDCKLKVAENKKQLSHWNKALSDLRNNYNEEMKEQVKYTHRYNVPATAAATTEFTAGNKEDAMDVEPPIDELPIYEADDLLHKYGKDSNGGIEDLKKQIALLEAEREQMAKKDVNMSALLAYLEKDADYRIRLEDLERVTAERNSVRKNYEDLRRQRLEEFMSGFGIITLKLKEMYQMITLGGDAELELVDSLDPFSEGIVFSVRPPKKSWKNISNLSGGEKTLSSLALVFALHHFKPTPLYVMDEIDAALDFKNVSIVANYIKERTKNAQFVIISLRNNMFELADRLVGIYKTNDATKSVTINPKLFDSVVAGGAPVVPPPTKVLSDTTNTKTTAVSAAQIKSKNVGSKAQTVL